MSTVTHLRIYAYSLILLLSITNLKPMKEPKYISIYLYAKDHKLSYDTVMRKIIRDKKAPTKIITEERILIREDYQVK